LEESGGKQQVRKKVDDFCGAKAPKMSVSE
jgi:hypothetical protein